MGFDVNTWARKRLSAKKTSVTVKEVKVALEGMPEAYTKTGMLTLVKDQPHDEIKVKLPPHDIDDMNARTSGVADREAIAELLCGEMSDEYSVLEDHLSAPERTQTHSRDASKGNAPLNGQNVPVTA